MPQKLITLGRFWQQSRVWTLQISTRVDIRALTRMWRLGSINKEPALRSQKGLKSKERSFSILYYHSDSYMFTYVATHVSNSFSRGCMGTPPWHLKADELKVPLHPLQWSLRSSLFPLLRCKKPLCYSSKQLQHLPLCVCASLSYCAELLLK